MGCLSNVDILNELGENIYIYPLNKENIKGSTINFTASKFAWSVGTGKKSALSSNEKEIIIPANDTVIIETEEIIYVTEKICGDYHSRVRLVSKGIGHIGTTLDPSYIGPSLIALHNNSTKNVSINVGDKITSLMLYYLDSSATKQNSNSSGHLEILNGCEKHDEVDKYLDQDWCKNPRDLRNKMIESSEYKKIDAIRNQEVKNKIKQSKKSLKYKLTNIIEYIIAIVFIIIIIFIIHLFLKIKIATIVTVVISGSLFPLGLKIRDFIKKFNDRRLYNAENKNKEN